MTTSNFKLKKGIALLMAVLVSGLFFVIAAAIFKIALVELILSSTGRDSQFAFYAADTGAECALFWNYKYQGGVYNDASAFSIYNYGNGDETSNRERLEGGTDLMISCNGGQIVNPFREGDFVGGGVHQTYFKIDLGNTGCADVVVSKFRQIDPAELPATRELETVARTTIVSRGYNTCNTENPRRVERAIKVTLD